MEITKDMDLNRRVSWGSIIAGVVTVIAVSLLLTTLGTSLGLSQLSPLSDDMLNGAHKTVLIWSVISIILSLGCGGFVSGRLAGKDGTIHGFLSWATSLIVVSVLGLAVAGGVVNMAGNVVGTVASAASGLGNSTGKVAGASADAGKSIVERLGLDTRLQEQLGDEEVLNALRKSNIRELQPEYLQSQLEAAGDDLATAVKDLAVNPDNNEVILNDLSRKLKTRADTFSKGISREDVKKALTENTQFAQEESEKIVDNIIHAREKAVNEVGTRLNQLENNLAEAKDQYVHLKKQAKEKADEAAKVGTQIALWSFFGLLFGAIISAVAGLWGVNSHPAYRNIRA